MKRMKSPEVLNELRKNPNYQMTEAEERLHDLLTFHKTGKRTPKFANRGKKKPVPKITVLKHDLKAEPIVLERNDPPMVSGVLMNDNIINPPSATS